MPELIPLTDKDQQAKIINNILNNNIFATRITNKSPDIDLTDQEFNNRTLYPTKGNGNYHYFTITLNDSDENLHQYYQPKLERVQSFLQKQGKVERLEYYDIEDKLVKNGYLYATGIMIMIADNFTDRCPDKSGLAIVMTLYDFNERKGNGYNLNNYRAKIKTKDTAGMDHPVDVKTFQQLTKNLPGSEINHFSYGSLMELDYDDPLKSSSCFVNNNYAKTLNDVYTGSLNLSGVYYILQEQAGHIQNVDDILETIEQRPKLVSRKTPPRYQEIINEIPLEINNIKATQPTFDKPTFKYYPQNFETLLKQTDQANQEHINLFRYENHFYQITENGVIELNN